MTPPTAVADATATLALEQLDPDHWPNPRGAVDTASDAFAELAASIEAQGLLEPIVVGPALDDAGGRHPIIAGWRRYTAALVSGLAEVPVHHRPDIDTELKALRAALAENLAREDMTPLAEAAAIAKLVELGDTQVQAAAAVGVSERTARERLRLLDLPAAVRKAIDAGHVPTTCTRRLQLVADVYAPAAVAIAKAMTKGDAIALDVLDDGRLAHILLRMQGGEFVQLRYGVKLQSLALPAAKAAELGKRSRKASPHGGDYIDLNPGWVGKKLLDEARAAGNVLSLDDHGREMLFLAGADFIARAAEASVAKADRQAAKRAADEKRRQAEYEARKGEDPAVRATREHKANVAALIKRAKPHAAHMNGELADRLGSVEKVRLDGTVARLVLQLVGDAPNIRNVAGFAARHVAGADLPGDWPGDDPSTAAAALVRACVAAVFCDPRANGKPLDPITRGIAGGYGLPTSRVRDVALELQLLPDRAVALFAAREHLDEQASYHQLRGERRRILYELSTADAPLTRDALQAKTQTWLGLGAAPGLVDVDGQIYGDHRFTQALEQVLQAGWATGGSDALALTAEGLAELQSAAVPAAPIIEDIDAADVVELQLVDEPAADAGELVIKLPQPEQSVPARQRRGRAAELVEEHPGITIPELARGMAVKQNALYRILPDLERDGVVRHEGRGWFPAICAARAGGVVIVHVTPTGGGDPVEAELQPDPAKGKSNSRKVIYTASRTAAWVAESRIVDLPAEAAAA